MAMDGLTVARAPFPSTLTGWFSALWTRVLFPGEASASAVPIPLWHVLVLVVLPAVLLYPCLSFPLFEPDEGRYAEIPREMLLRGDGVVPYLQGEVYLDKPPLVYWLVQGSYCVFGVHDWAARLVPALAVHATILLVWLLGRRSLGEASAFRAALVLALSPGFLGMGRLLLLDGVLTLWTTLALLAAFEAVRGPRLAWSWWIVAACACGLGVLTKGPVAVVLLVPPVWLYQRLSGRGATPGLWGWAALGGIVLVVTLPWYLAICMRVPAFFRDFFWEHHVRRFLAPFAHQQGVWYYLPVLLAGLLPTTLLAWPLVRFLVSPATEDARRRSPELGFFLLAGLWCVLFFTLSACKLPTYVLPAFGPLALVMGHFLAGPRWYTSRLVTVGAITAFAVLLFSHSAGVPWYARFRSPMAQEAALRRLCSAPEQTVVCYPRNCDSVSFYLGRADLTAYRSKDIDDLRALVRGRPRTVILCTHRHSLRGLKQLLPADVRIVEEVHVGLEEPPGLPRALRKAVVALLGETALGLCDIAVVEPCPPGQWRHVEEWAGEPPPTHDERP